METRAKRKKVDDAHQRMDPLQSALNQHLLQELMFQHLAGDEVKKIFKVSTLWNEIASNSVKCGAKLKLVINTDDDDEILTIIKTNGRKYSAIELEHNRKNQEFSETLPLLLDCVASIAWSLKELQVWCPMSIEVLVQLLTSLYNLEVLELQERIKSFKNTNFRPLQLPKLKVLNCQNISIQLLGLFYDVATLNKFIFTSVIRNIDVRLIEDLIMRQDELKCLVFVCNFPLFADKNRLNEMKFQLEAIGLRASAIHTNSAIQFFNQQKTLKYFDLYHHPEQLAGTAEEHCAVLRSIFTLPKLYFLRIFCKNFIINEDFINLEDIRNTAVKLLELKSYVEETIVHGKLVEMFPNLQRISVVPNFFKSSLSLEDVRVEKLSLIHCPNLSRLFYRPPLVNFDQIFFEDKLEKFLLNNRNIESLTIGHNEWFVLNIKLSLEFLKKVFKMLPRLKTLQITYPGNVDDFINLLKTQCKDVKAVIRTNAIA